MGEYFADKGKDALIVYVIYPARCGLPPNIIAAHQAVKLILVTSFICILAYAAKLNEDNGNGSPRPTDHWNPGYDKPLISLPMSFHYRWSNLFRNQPV